MSRDNLKSGVLAEDRAEGFLKASGYKILQRNYKTKLGEVDIVARDKDTLCFIEVKFRSSDRFGSGLEAVSGLKQRQISKAALSFLKEKNLLDKRARFDVLSLDCSGSAEKITLIKNAFDLDARFSY
ncbi:MAG: YraN family protein [Candidatus Omnitrophota bacterium]|nr:YraN family protein [Candidatus Omnitrophota bacterium]